MHDQAARLVSFRVPPIRPLLHKARSAFAGAPAIEAIARATVLCGAEVSRVQKAIVLPDRLERLRDFQSASEKERVFRSVSGGEMHHDASIAYTVADARLEAGSIYAGGARHSVRQMKQRYPRTAPAHFARAALCSNSASDRYFGHFLTEDLLQTMIAGPFGEPFRLPARNWPHLEFYRRALDLEWRDIGGATFDELTVFADVAQNSLRQRRYRELRARLRRNVAAAAPGGRIYLRRGATGVVRSPRLNGDGSPSSRLPRILRQPANEGEVAAEFARRGFDVIDLETAPPEALLARLLDARVIAGAEGSHMMHGVYTLAADGGVAILMPPMRPMITVKDRFDALGVPCAIVVGDDLGTEYRIDLADLNRTLDLLETRLAR